MHVYFRNILGIQLNTLELKWARPCWQGRFTMPERRLVPAPRQHFVIVATSQLRPPATSILFRIQIFQPFSAQPWWQSEKIPASEIVTGLVPVLPKFSSGPAFLVALGSVSLVPSILIPSDQGG
jgi:hypothetical protein